MKTNKSFLLLALCLCCFAYKGQVLKTKLIRLADKSYMGFTDTVDNMPILVNVNNNIVVSGNQRINASQYDATTVEQLSSGIQNWINQISASGEKSFITASCNDASGNIYNTGAYRSNSSNGLDFFVQKLTPGGSTAWTKYYDNGMNDGAIAICADPSGNVYITGPSEGTGLIDYATVAFDGAGNLKWSRRYDHSSLIDVPTAIFYEPTANRIYVTGSSANSFTDWDFATVKYNAVSGTQMDVERVSGGVGNDKVLGAVTDGDGNIYTVGTAFNGTNYDMQLVKIDSSFNQVFVKTFDAYGLDDAGIAVSLDSKGNIIVLGTSYVNSATTELIILKYDKNGNKLWDKHRRGKGGQSAEGLRLKIKSDNEYLVAGNYGTGIDQDIALLCYDSLGYVSIETSYDDSGFRDRLMDMTFEGNHIYLTARTMNSANAPMEQNLILHYEYTDITQNVVVLGSGVSEERYVDHELIISFNKKACKMSRINDRGQTFGTLQEFVADSTCDKITGVLDLEGVLGVNARSFPVRKIFFDLTEADSLSESRTGNYVKIPEFYTSFVVTLPNWISTTGAASSLNGIRPDIRYSQLNAVYRLASPPTPPSTNDPNYAIDQGALHPTSLYPNANVNVDTAWAITTGEPFVKIGFLDSGIEPHPDLPSNISGYDFLANTSLGNGDWDNHGTPVSGAAVAIRNNGIGVAGVAGGDATASKPGPTIYDCRVSQGGYPPENIVAAGIHKAATGQNAGGFGVHILNFGIYYGGSYLISQWGRGVSASTIEQLNYANRNGVVLNCPKANFGLGTNIFPADWSDEIIMSIGSNGWDGEHCRKNINCTNNSTTWGQIDFVAPGTMELVTSTSSQGGFMKTHGTSLATPHVSGASALIQSYRNKNVADWNNLVHEDIEQILQRTATDLTVTPVYNETVGYDTVTGWGRINIYRAIRELNKNYYRIRHVSESVGNTSTSGGSPTLIFTDSMEWKNYPGVPNGKHITEVYKRTVVMNYTLLPSEKLIDGWPLNKECYGVKFDSTFVDGDRPNYSRIDNLTPSSCTMTTFYYKIPSLNVYMPYEPGYIRSAFSVYTYDSTGTVGVKDYGHDLVNYSRFKVFPNPNKGSFIAEFNADFTEILTFKITNMLGQVVHQGEYRAIMGINQLKINSYELTNGIYIFSIFNGTQELHKQKIIKQE
jgi:hypothetical protein